MVIAGAGFAFFVHWLVYQWLLLQLSYTATCHGIALAAFAKNRALCVPSWGAGGSCVNRFGIVSVLAQGVRVVEHRLPRR